MKTIYTRTELLNLEQSLQHEYLLTNGRGGYCSSTILDCHKRKYSGLLVLQVPGREKRFNLLSKLDCTAVIKKNEYQLATNKFPNVYYPTGHQYVEKFEWDGYPATAYRIGDTLLVKSVLMPRGGDAVLVRWDVKKSKFPVTLKAEPFFAYRDIHSLMTRNMAVRPRAFPEKNGFKFAPYDGLPATYVQTSRKSTFYPSPNWWTEFEYLKERNRGYPYQEDLFTPGAFEVKLKEGESVIFRGGLSAAGPRIRAEWDAELKRMKALRQKYVRTPEPLRTLKVSAEQYLIEPEADRADVIAGYPWFGCWGRDTFISLAGLCLCTKNGSVMRRVLESYAAYQRDGLFPNMVGATGGHAYNSIDAPLLYVRAVQQYLDATGDESVCRGKVGAAAVASMEALLDDRVPQVRLDHGFLYAGTPRTNLTWMDANVNGVPVTPRHGAAVEINALWYNALMFMLQECTGTLPGELRDRMAHEADLFRGRFMDAFWCEENECLFDVYRNHDDRDACIRPNQLFALGLPHRCVPDDAARRALDTVKRHLVTPYGLRTLSPRNPAYRSTYTGSQEGRDAAYHQGMAWPWLVGIFGDAVLAHTGDAKQAKEYLLDMFEPFAADHMTATGLDHISEIFTPNPPYTPKGCFAQAWSVAEVLRLLETLRAVK